MVFITFGLLAAVKMPTYVVSTHSDLFDVAQKGEIVKKISQIHSEEGGNVPQFLVQVIFNEVKEGNWFVNKMPVPSEQIWIRGDIRAGRK